MSTAGTKRSAPGADGDDEDVHTEFDAEIAPETRAKLKEASKLLLRAELANDRANHQRLLPAYKARRDIVKSIAKFWPIALLNSPSVAPFAQHPEDLRAFIALEDVWVERDPVESRAFTLEFHFKENKYFTDKVLKKVYKYVAPPAAADDKPDEYGITDSMLDFSWERDVEPGKIEINWKSDAVKLTKLHPRVTDKNDPTDVAEPGSFFNLFEYESDPFELGMTIANEVYPEAVDFFEGKVPDEDEMSMVDEDEDDEEDDDDEDDDAEIDLEKPEPKKQKRA